MYRRPKFLELLIEIREQMSRDADFDMDLFSEMVRSGKISENQKRFDLKQKANPGKRLKSKNKK